MRKVFVLLSILGVGLLECDTHKVVDASSNVSHLLNGRCIELETSVFVLHRTDQSRKFMKVPSRTLALPSTTLTPFPIASFRQGRPMYTPYGIVESVLPQGGRLRLSRILIKYGFEGSTLAIVAVTEGGTEVETSYLFDDLALVHLLDGAEGAGPVPRMGELLNPRYAKWCVARE